MVNTNESGALTVNEFLAWAKIGRTKFYEEVKENRIKPRRLGRKVLILRADAETWLNSLPEAT